MPIKILLVDDDDAYRSVTAIALESEGCVVQEAMDGFAALATLRADLSNLPDVIVSDLEMPGFDGRRISAVCELPKFCTVASANPAFSTIDRTWLMSAAWP